MTRGLPTLGLRPGYHPKAEVRAECGYVFCSAEATAQDLAGPFRYGIVIGQFLGQS